MSSGGGEVWKEGDGCGMRRVLTGWPQVLRPVSCGVFLRSAGESQQSCCSCQMASWAQGMEGPGGQALVFRAHDYNLALGTSHGAMGKLREWYLLCGATTCGPTTAQWKLPEWGMLFFPDSGLRPEFGSERRACLPGLHRCIEHRRLTSIWTNRLVS